VKKKEVGQFLCYNAVLGYLLTLAEKKYYGFQIWHELIDKENEQRIFDNIA
jgi:hypothetical protein